MRWSWLCFSIPSRCYDGRNDSTIRKWLEDTSGFTMDWCESKIPPGEGAWGSAKTLGCVVPIPGGGHNLVGLEIGEGGHGCFSERLHLEEARLAVVSELH